MECLAPLKTFIPGVNPTDMIRLGLIGCGEHAEGSHAVPLARYASENPDEVFLAAACDLRLERAREFCRRYAFARPYTDFEEMLSKEVLDGCISVMPMERIAEVGIRLLQTRIPCVIEKPLGVSLTQVSDLLEAAEETETPHMVSVNRRFMPLLNAGLDWAKKIGPLRYVRCTMIRHERNESDFIWSTAVHAIDALRYVAGDISEFNVRTQRTEEPTAQWYLISLQFHNGAVGHVELLPTAGMVQETYELAGEGFRASVTSPFGQPLSMYCWQRNKLVLEEIASLDAPEDVMNGGYNEVIEFVKALRTGTAPYPSIKEVAPSVQLCFQLAEKIAQNELRRV
jgi:myo-inositol 2-dehydrogenase / D-chiro-inositol 1-dehydrogenase